MSLLRYCRLKAVLRNRRARDGAYGSVEGNEKFRSKGRVMREACSSTSLGVLKLLCIANALGQSKNKTLGRRSPCVIH